MADSRLPTHSQESGPYRFYFYSHEQTKQILPLYSCDRDSGFTAKLAHASGTFLKLGLRAKGASWRFESAGQHEQSYPVEKREGVHG